MPGAARICREGDYSFIVPCFQEIKTDELRISKFSVQFSIASIVQYLGTFTTGYTALQLYEKFHVKNLEWNC